MDAPVEEQVGDGLVKGYIVWYSTDGRSYYTYPKYPVMEWYPDGGGKAQGRWLAACLVGHPYEAELKSLAAWAGPIDGTHCQPGEFSEYFTFPKEWMEGVENVRHERSRD